MPVSATNSLPLERDFLRLCRSHTLVPVYRTVAADLETPVSAFLRIAAEEPEAFLLESVEGGEHVGRYTFIGIEPYKKMVARGNQISVREGRSERHFTGDVFEELKKSLTGHKPAKISGLPPFTAGAVGFFAYDVVRQIEKLPTRAKDELGVPDACLMFFDQVLVFDHVKKEIHLIVTTDLAREERRGLRPGGAEAEPAGKEANELPACAQKEEDCGQVEADAANLEGSLPKSGGEDERIRCGRRCVSVRTVAAVRLRTGRGRL